MNISHNSIQEIYRKLILKHYHQAFNRGLIENFHLPMCTAQEENKICGEKIILQIAIDQQKLIEIRYETQGCAILIASASLMSMHLKNLNLCTIIKKIINFLNMIDEKPFDKNYLEKDLLCLQEIKHFPGRILCVSLPWKLLLQMIQKNN
ncbi:iron-sulfur cluster assembly scaffold protein [Candidatus Phytoplasma phoenicium]|uniref:NifU-like N terminal domain n=1 Tax=Candidatus Phytoplasma phoenicium TaxID=198422 RepID=A0A0L0ML29_9MOLU|nr:iron-sulfur cluster assembly scaffold protein [Candidatus Phytoplasma phoenicium]KND62704.1 NifU-like N terminal domain [Candidatus Phytoplasma phoenicium]